jgi:hypothetical protein
VDGDLVEDPGAVDEAHAHARAEVAHARVGKSFRSPESAKVTSAFGVTLTCTSGFPSRVTVRFRLCTADIVPMTSSPRSWAKLEGTTSRAARRLQPRQAFFLATRSIEVSFSMA